MTPPTAGRLAIPLVALLAAPSAALADDGDAQVWMSVAASGSVSGRLTASFDANTRFYDNAAHLAHFQVRAMLGWDVAKDFNIGAGYSHVRSMPRDGADVHENRAFQQASFPILQAGEVRFTGRTRFEQRFFSNLDGMRLRFRQQVKMAVPLAGPDGLKAVVQSEALFLLNNQGSTAAGLNQLRTFAGLSIPLRGKTALEAGYLNQAVFAGDDRFNHVLSLGLTTGF